MNKLHKRGDDDALFLREGVVDIDAAVVGVSRVRWTCIQAAEVDVDRAVQKMKDNRFDILPIEDGDAIKEYFQTKQWNNYSAVERKSINHRDVIPATTQLREVIRAFSADFRNFYFLGAEKRIVGLISVANLNCRQVKVYLFSLLSELEMELGKLLKQNCSEDDLLDLTFRRPDPKDKHLKLKERYEKDQCAGIEVPIVEYLYLSDMVRCIRTKKLFGQLDFESAGKYDDALNPLVTLRDNVMHPVRSLITKPEECQDLWRYIDRIEQLLFSLHVRT